MSWTLTTSGAAIAKAGTNANSTIVTSGSALALWSDMAEAQVSTLTKKDWVADYSSIGTNFKAVLSDITSDIVAMKIINYDTSSFTRLLEAQTMLDVLRDNISRNTEILREEAVKDFIA